VLPKLSEIVLLVIAIPLKWFGRTAQSDLWQWVVKIINDQK
jgi:hypothetical protein